MEQITAPPIVSIIGRSGAGKTTFLTKLVSELKHRGYRVAVLKHHGIKTPGVDGQGSNTAGAQNLSTPRRSDMTEASFDTPGKDTWRHFQAGAETVIISGRNQMAMYHRLAHEPDPDELVQLLPGKVDIVLTEGYTSAGKPAIEILRSTHNPQPLTGNVQLLAIVSDLKLSRPIPQFELNDAPGVATLLERQFSLAAVDQDIRRPTER